MSLVAIGLNHRTVPLDVLERLTVDEARLPKVLHDLVGRDNLTEVVVLSTCNRIEVYAYVERFHGAFEDVRNFFGELGFMAPEEFADHLYAHYDDAAAQHLFSVASGVDSAVLGENEILGQVRVAWERSVAEDACGPVLGSLMRHAVETGKRVRTETGISRHIASVSQAAVAMASERLGSLDGRSVVILGAGEMGEGMARALQSGGVAELAVVNRTWQHAVDLAERVDGVAIGLDQLTAALGDADVLLTSTGASSLLLEHADLATLMASRPERPLLVVDIAVPRDVDPAAADVAGVTLLDMDDLRAFADKGIDERRRELADVEQIVDEEVERYRTSVTEREVAPLVAAFRARAEAIRRGELDRFSSRLDRLEPEQAELVEAITHGVLGKLLYTPTVRLKDAAGTPRGDRLAEALRDLFEL